MLISSHRHRPEDLAIWAELEAADRINGERLIESGRIERAIAEIRRFAADGPCYCAVSWGKDSVVVADLVMRAGVDVPLCNIWQAGSQHDPEVFRVRDEFLRVWGSPEFHQIDVAAGDFGQRDNSRAASLVAGISQATRKFGTTRYIGGVRSEESFVRRMRAIMGSKTTCQPLNWWSAGDVFGYLAARGLPVHPAYAMTGGGRWSREHIRVSIIGGQKGRGWGRLDWEREYYGDLIRQMECNREFRV